MNTCVANIDMPNDKPPTSPLTLLHSYHLLFCMRCFLTDCTIHKGAVQLIKPNSLIHNNENILPKPADLIVLDSSFSNVNSATTKSKEPCSNDCFMLHLNSFKPKSQIKKQNSTESITTTLRKSSRSQSPTKTPFNSKEKTREFLTPKLTKRSVPKTNEKETSPKSKKIVRFINKNFKLLF